uniref:Uncharacterized protein n=1 Tax=uncultured marine virus TaxID=186617 RepID=A0A0F7L9V8_9VIRU|nr:hypothetical protein [uncultured marine virus]
MSVRLWRLTSRSLGISGWRWMTTDTSRRGTAEAGTRGRSLRAPQAQGSRMAARERLT